MSNYSFGSVCIDTIGIVLMCIMLFNFRKKTSRQSFDQKLFFWAGLADLLVIILDLLTWIMDNNDAFSPTTYNIVCSLLYMCGPFMTTIWCGYYDYKIFKDTKKLKKRVWIYLSLALINFVVCFAQLFTPILFTISSSNAYTRLPLAFITYAIPFVYFTFTEILLIVNRRKVQKNAFWPLASYAVFPLIGIILNAIFGLSTIYISSAFAFLIIFFRVQNDLSVTDYLTNLNNRRHLEAYLQEEMSHLRQTETLYAIMFDIDDFKKINDEYGHAAGDRALVDLSDIFIKTVRKNDFVSRYAGDEFIIVLKMEGKGNIERVIGDVNKALDIYNRFNTAPFKLACSYGYTAYKPGEKEEVFLKRLDEEMYFNKNRKKERQSKGLKFF